MDVYLLVDLFLAVIGLLGGGVVAWTIFRGDYDGSSDLFGLGLTALTFASFWVSFTFFRPYFFITGTLVCFISMLLYYQREVVTSTRPSYRNTLFNLAIALFFVYMANKYGLSL